MAAAAALPKWVMLERFVFRRDDPSSFREDKRTSATGTTCTGARFDVSFILAEPPTPSRLYFSSAPEGAKLIVTCNLVAAHRNLVLLRLDSLVDESRPYRAFRHEYFVYIADPTSPWLRPLAQCLETIPDIEDLQTRAFPELAVGLLCHGKDEFVVANLSVLLSPVQSEPCAELWMLRASLSHCSDGGRGREEWESKVLTIQCQADDDRDYLANWVTNEVVPFKNSMCWVNYSCGIIFCHDICGDNPKVSYIPFPQDKSLLGEREIHYGRKELYRSLCITGKGGGQRLVFADVARDDRKGLGPMAPDTGFTLTLKTLSMTESDNTQWRWSTDAVVTSAQLWQANTPVRLPREVMMLPLLSVDTPHVVHVVLYDWSVGRFSLVTINLRDNNKVQGSVVTYIKSENDLDTDDADLVKVKPTFVAHFIPSEFPKYLTTNRKKAHP